MININSVKKGILVSTTLLSSTLLCAAEKTSFIETKSAHLDAPYVVSGNQIYCVGYQDGTFPPMGDHVKGEMGGIWAQPIKLLDGFSLCLKDNNKGKIYDHLKAIKFVTRPYQCEWYYHIEDIGLQIKCTLFAPLKGKALRVEYALLNQNTQEANLQISFIGKTDLRSGFFSDKAGWTNAPDSMWIDSAKKLVKAKDLKNNWYLAVSSDSENAKIETTTATEAEALHPNQQEVMNVEKTALPAGLFRNKIFSFTDNREIASGSNATLSFYISGSTDSEEEAVAENNRLRNNYAELFAEKKGHFQEIIQRSHIQIPDKKLQNVYNWVKFNTDWLIQEVPEIGRGFCAGYPHYIWWFGTDNSYALQGILATGDFENAKSTLRLLKEHSIKCNGNGRVIHEVVPSGAIVNPGNTQETAHFIMAVWNTYLWTGDKNFLNEFYPFVKQGIEWLLTTQDKNHNLFPEGYGIMEVKGLNAELIDVAVYTQQALLSFSNMAKVIGENESHEKYAQLAQTLKDKINDLFWDEHNSLYCDFYGTAEQAISVVDGSLEQYKDIPDVVKFYNETKKYFQSFATNYKHGWSTNRNWVINTPIETGIAPEEKALAALERMEENDMTSQWGPYLSAVDKLHNMTISTGVQAVSQARYGNIDHSLMHVNQIAATFGLLMPGSITEMMPDYGCFCQEWTIYSVAVPIIQYIYGIKPNAPEHSVTLEPQIPTGWNTYSLTDQRIGENKLDMSVSREENVSVYKAAWDDASWNIQLIIPFDPTAIYTVNGKRQNNIKQVAGKAYFNGIGHLDITVSPAL